MLQQAFHMHTLSWWPNYWSFCGQVRLTSLSWCTIFFLYFTDTGISCFRKAITKMMCMKCLVIQPIGPKCTSQSCSGFSMGKYYCRICKLFDDERWVCYACLIFLEILTSSLYAPRLNNASCNWQVIGKKSHLSCIFTLQN